MGLRQETTRRLRDRKQIAKLRLDDDETVTRRQGICVRPPKPYVISSLAAASLYDTMVGGLISANLSASLCGSKTASGWQHLIMRAHSCRRTTTVVPVQVQRTNGLVTQTPQKTLRDQGRAGMKTGTCTAILGASAACIHHKQRLHWAQALTGLVEAKDCLHGSRDAVW